MAKNPFGGIFGGGGIQNNPPGPGNPPVDPAQQQQQVQQNQQTPLHEEEEEDSQSFLASIFADGEDDGEDDDDESSQRGQGNPPSPGNGQQQQQQQQQPSGETREQQLITRLGEQIKGMSIPEDMVPENFDPSDPKQLRDFLGKVQQQTAVSTLQLAMQPMQLAIESMTQQFRSELRDALKNHGQSSSMRSTLEKIVPEASNPELSGLVNTIFDRVRKTEKDPTKVANSVRKALDAMGIKGSKGGGSGNDSDPSSGGYKSGAEALDIFAPIPKQ